MFLFSQKQLPNNFYNIYLINKKKNKNICVMLSHVGDFRCFLQNVVQNCFNNNY